MVTGLLKKIFGSRNDRLLKQYKRIVAQINSLEQGIASLDDAALQAKTAEFKSKLAAGQTIDEILPEAFAIVR
jgi:preprotein translocase subunit SecA